VGVVVDQRQADEQNEEDQTSERSLRTSSHCPGGLGAQGGDGFIVLWVWWSDQRRADEQDEEDQTSERVSTDLQSLSWWANVSTSFEFKLTATSEQSALKSWNAMGPVQAYVFERQPW